MAGMKVALSFPGCFRRGGVERIMLECGKFLVRRGHDVHIFASKWDQTLPTTDGAGVTFHRVPLPPVPPGFEGAAYYRRCTAALKGQTFDVLSTHGVVCPTGGVMWAQSIHAAWIERSRQIRPPFSIARWRQRLNPLHPVILKLEAMHFRPRRYRKVIATTPQVRADLGRFYGVPAEDVVIVPNGFNPDEFNPQARARARQAARARLGLTDDQPALLFVGNELDRKGFPTVVRAMRELARPDVRLLVVGRVSEAAVRAVAEAAGVSGQVIYSGPTERVAEYHAAADLFVLPTQYEAFCLAILEALGSGLPVVTSTAPGAGDAIVRGVNGALVEDPQDPGELARALRPLLDPSARNPLSDAAPDSVTKYQWPNVMLQYESVLLDSVGQPAHGAGSAAD
jgi:UDP-glucose:(heptosyl)LPS alpha-1,3-glucosyltransferase